MTIQQTFEFLEPTRTKPAPKVLHPLAREPEDPLVRLRHQIRGLTIAGERALPVPTYSSGCAVMDAWLPRNGFRSNAITEWVADRDSSGAAMVSMISTVSRMRTAETQGPLVVIADDNHFHPPAAAAIGMDVSRLIWVRPPTHADVVWSIDQALRCPAVSAVWAHVGGSLDDRDARRFQLAAESGGTPGILVRPQSARGRPSFSEVRMHVAALPTRSTFDFLSVRVTLDRCRGRSGGRSADLWIDPNGKLQVINEQDLSTNTTQPHQPYERSSKALVHLAAELAHPKTSSSTTTERRSAG